MLFDGRIPLGVSPEEYAARLRDLGGSVGRALDAAEESAKYLPPGEEKEKLLKAITERQQRLGLQPLPSAEAEPPAPAPESGDVVSEACDVLNIYCQDHKISKDKRLLLEKILAAFTGEDQPTYVLMAAAGAALYISTVRVIAAQEGACQVHTDRAIAMAIEEHAWWALREAEKTQGMVARLFGFFDCSASSRMGRLLEALLKKHCPYDGVPVFL